MAQHEDSAHRRIEPAAARGTRNRTGTIPLASFSGGTAGGFELSITPAHDNELKTGCVRRLPAQTIPGQLQRFTNAIRPCALISTVLAATSHLFVEIHFGSDDVQCTNRIDTLCNSVSVQWKLQPRPWFQFLPPVTGIDSAHYQRSGRKAESNQHIITRCEAYVHNINSNDGCRGSGTGQNADAAGKGVPDVGCSAANTSTASTAASAC